MEDGLNVEIRDNVFASPEEIFERLEKEIVYLPEEQCQIRIKGKTYPISRQMVAFGDPDLSYTFSGLTLTSQPWPPLLLEIKTLVENLMGMPLNFVLINRYENGNACIGQHKDNESDMDENYPICSLSFGETRTMVFKRPGFADKRIKLKSNSLLLMKPPTNTLWSHGIPKQKKCSGVRINLTFRMMKTPSCSNNNKRKLDKEDGNSKKWKEDLPIEGTFRENEPWCDSLDRKYLGRDLFLDVNHFLGQTRVHIRRFVAHPNGELHATKDGVSLSPKVWHSFCREINTILNHRSPEKTLVIQRDLCVSKQLKDGVEVYVFQRLFQRKNLSLKFVPQHVVLRGPEFKRLIEHRSIITDRVKNGLITYTLSHFIFQHLKTGLDFKPEYSPDASTQLHDTMNQCLLTALTEKISELINCFGCREGYPVSFMHDCLAINRPEKWTEHFDLALFSINMGDVAQDIVQRNLNMDFQFVLGQEEFFDAIDIPKLFQSLEKKYVEEEQNMVDNDLLNFCNTLCIN